MTAAIVTRYFPPTTHRPARIVASVPAPMNPSDDAEHRFEPVTGLTGCARCGYARGHHPNAHALRAMGRAVATLALLAALATAGCVQGPPAGFVAPVVRLIPPCLEDEVVVGVGDYSGDGYWTAYQCEPFDGLD